jgi:hypothetical protein
MHIRIVIRRLVGVVLLVSYVLVSPVALAGYREELHVSEVEIALLPTFCWAQLEVPDAKGDQFRIRDCGPAANHYCPGLIYLIRGKRSGAKGKALPLIRRADTDVAYTERAIADAPKCSIREHVETTRAEINHLLRLYGSKPAAAK